MIESHNMPADIDLEKSLLASIFAYDDSGIEILRPEHFYKISHQDIFKSIRNLQDRSEPADVGLIASELKSMGKNPKDYHEAFNSILEFPPAGSTTAAAKRILGYYQLREIIKASYAGIKRSFAAGPDNAAQVFEYMKSELSRIAAASPSTWRPLSEIVSECMDIADEMAKRRGITGVPSGYRDLDWFTCGFQPGDLIILAARPGIGKTAFAINCILNSAKQGYQAGKLSLEMARHQVGNRALAIESRINALKFRSGRFIPEDWERMIEAAGGLSNLPIWIDDAPRASHHEVATKAKNLVTQSGARIIWVDYLGFLEGDKSSSNKVQEIESITRTLKQTAKDLAIPIVLVCQLSRKCEERPNKRPILSDLRDSGAIEQDADVVMFLYRDDYYNAESNDKGVTELIIAKQRNGPTGCIKLRWMEEYTLFANIEKNLTEGQQ